MIFLNNSSAGASRMSGRRVAQFGTISRSSGQDSDGRYDESDNVLLGCIVGSFGIAITLALILLPLSICCSALVYHPFFIMGFVLFIVLTLFGGVLCICHPIFAKCWWYKDESQFCTKTQERRRTSLSTAYRYKKSYFEYKTSIPSALQFP